MILKNKHKGKRCFIVATGTSINNLDLSYLKNEITIGINLILHKENFVPNYLCIADTTVMEKHYNDIFNNKMLNSIYVLCNGCNIINKNFPNRHGNCHNNLGSTCRGVILEDKYKNIFTVKHDEKLGINDNGPRMINPDKYYIDTELNTISSYGGSTIDNLAIPLAVHLGCNEIYLIGADAGWDHFYDNVSGKDKREWINYNHVLPILKDYGVKLYNSDPTNVFSELEYKKYEEVI